LKHHIFGIVVAYVYVIEFQKRGLPHSHILLILDQNSKPKTVDDYDAFVSAEIPDKNLHHMAYDTICRSMMHGPCGSTYPNAPCMKAGKCSKKYPHSFCTMTSINENGYPVYQRSHDGRSVEVKGTRLDNRWVVPHNLYLATKYDAHINVEICSSIAAVNIKY